MLGSPLDSKEIKPVNPKGNQFWIFIGGTDAEAETPVLWPPDAKHCLIWKDPDAGKDWGQEEKGWQMVEWHHWLNGHEFEQTLRDNGQGSLACCSPWHHKESDTTNWLNNYKTPICNMSSSFFTTSLAPCVIYFVPPLVEVSWHSSKILDSNFLMISKAEHLFFV